MGAATSAVSTTSAAAAPEPLLLMSLPSVGAALSLTGAGGMVSGLVSASAGTEGSSGTLSAPSSVLGVLEIEPPAAWGPVLAGQAPSCVASLAMLSSAKKSAAKSSAS